MWDTATATKAAKQGRKSRVTSLSMYQGNGYTIYVRVCGHISLVFRTIILLLLLMVLTFEGLHDYRMRLKFRGINFRGLIRTEFRGYLFSWGVLFVAKPSLDFSVLSSTRSLIPVNGNVV